MYPGYASYVPDHIFDRLLERRKGEDETPNEGPAYFRGTMLDRVSFEVDVREWGLPDEARALREAQCSDGERRA